MLASPVQSSRSLARRGGREETLHPLAYNGPFERPCTPPAGHSRRDIVTDERCRRVSIPLENGTAGWEPAGGREEEGSEFSPGKRRKPSEFFIGKNSIREREVPVFVIGHPREGRRRAGGACPAQRYPLIEGMVDRERSLSIPSSTIYNVPFVRPLSKKSITRQHARVPNPLPPCPRSGKRCI